MCPCVDIQMTSCTSFGIFDDRSRMRHDFLAVASWTFCGVCGYWDPRWGTVDVSFPDNNETFFLVATGCVYARCQCLHWIVHEVCFLCFPRLSIQVWPVRFEWRKYDAVWCRRLIGTFSCRLSYLPIRYIRVLEICQPVPVIYYRTSFHELNSSGVVCIKEKPEEKKTTRGKGRRKQVGRKQQLRSPVTWSYCTLEGCQWKKRSLTMWISLAKFCSQAAQQYFAELKVQGISKIASTSFPLMTAEVTPKSSVERKQNDSVPIIFSQYDSQSINFKVETRLFLDF